MLEKFRHLMGRFPNKEEKMQDLWQTNAAFESLVHRHGEVSDRLHSISRIGAEPGREAEELRRRQAALEEEMLIIMDQSSRV